MYAETAMVQEEMKKEDPAPKLPQKKGIELDFDFDKPGLIDWLRRNHCGLILSSYKTHRLISIGVIYDEKSKQDNLSIWVTNIGRPMGVHVDGDSVWVGGQAQLFKYQNIVNPGRKDEQGFDYTLIPRLMYTTSDIDTHDITLIDGEPHFISAMFSCIAKPSTTKSFKFVWKPPFIDKICPEDRCHLNGLCEVGGRVKYVTMASRSNVRDGWKGKRDSGGQVMDVETGEVVCKGLSMPHSPRWYRGELWVLNSGEGYLGTVDLSTKTFKRRVFIPGFLRGLSFHQNFAIVGSSQDRHEDRFTGLQIGKTLDDMGQDPVCGVFICNLDTNQVDHKIWFGAPLVEMYDVAVIPGITRPRVLDVSEPKMTLHHDFEM